jgi:hypothetical protein
MGKKNLKSEITSKLRMALRQFYEELEKRISEAIKEGIAFGETIILKNYIKAGNIAIAYESSYPDFKNEMHAELIISKTFGNVSEVVSIKETYPLLYRTGFRFISYSSSSLIETLKTFIAEEKKLKKLARKEPIAGLKEDLERLIAKLHIQEIMLRKDYVSMREVENVVNFFFQAFMAKLQSEKQ